MHTEKTLGEKGHDFIEGSLVFVTAKVATDRPEIAKWLGKQVVQRKCESCESLHFRATSDLHQTPATGHSLCDACGKKFKKLRKATEKAAIREALAAKAAPKAEPAPVETPAEEPVEVQA